MDRILLAGSAPWDGSKSSAAVRARKSATEDETGMGGAGRTWLRNERMKKHKKYNKNEQWIKEAQHRKVASGS